MSPDLSVEALAAGAAAQAVRRIAVVPDQVVTLPAGTDLGAITVQGRDLIVPLPDGTRLVVVDGAVFVPQFVVGQVEVPPATLVALLIGHEPVPAGGVPPSSGGNFAVPVGGLGDSFARGDLLPPTELAFTVPTAQFLDIDPTVARDPSLTIITPLTPAGALNASANVFEAGLPARGAEPPGSTASANTETTTGTFAFDPGNGPATLTVNGVALTAVGQTLATTYGVLTVTSIAPDAIGYSYTLSDNTFGDVSDVLTVVVTDADTGRAQGSLTIAIVDDAPTANADVDRVAAPTGPATASVTTSVDLTNAALYAGVPAGGTQLALNGATLTAVNGSLGYYLGASVFSASDGRADQTYTREIDAVNDQPEALRVAFATDQSEVRLTLAQLYRENILSSTPNPERATVTVSLADGTTQTRTVVATQTAQPGIAIVTLSAADFGGQLIRGVTLSPDPTPPTLPATLSAADRAFYSTFVYSEFVLAGISYDVPSGATTAPFADGNVLTGVGGTDANASDGTADVRGADGAGVTGVVAGAAASASGNLGTAIAGTYGALVMAADGSYRYTPSATNPTLRALIPGETRTDVFTYTITDGDGDASTTTLTITIDGVDDPVAITGLNPAITGGDVIVAEANLPGGSAPGAASTTQGGTFAIVAPDGYGNATVGGQTILSGGTFTAATIATPLGNTLSVTGFDAATGIISYQYALNGPASTPGLDRTTETFAVTATDRNGSTASGSLIATILDDSPVANPDVDSVTRGSASTTQTTTTTVDFTDAALFNGLASGSTGLTVGGVTVTSINGALSYYQGASVLSPSDGQPRQTWTAEIDSYNDQPEGLRLTFAQAQAAVTVTVGNLYREQTFTSTPDAEKVTVSVLLDDNSTATRTITATATAQPGAASIALSSADFGGHLIRAVTLVADPSLPTLPPGVTPAMVDPAYRYNATVPFSDFVLRGVDYQVTTPVAQARSVADGNVLTGIGGTDANATDGVADLPGADGARVTGVGVQYDPTTGTVGVPLAGTFGTLTLAADGSYTYVLNNDLPRVQNLAQGQTLTERFSYAITDGDGDRSQTTLTITIRPPAATGAAPSLAAASVASAARESAVATTGLTTTLVAAAVAATVAAPAATVQAVAATHANDSATAGTTATTPDTHAATATPHVDGTAAITASASTPPIANVAHESTTTTSTEHAATTGGVAGTTTAVAPVESHGASAAAETAATPHAAPAAAILDASAIPVAMPAPAATAAVPVAADAHVANVIADALHGGATAGSVGIDSLLAALPQADPAATPAQPVAVAEAPGLHDLSAAWAMMAAAQASAAASAGHDGVTVLAHAA